MALLRFFLAVIIGYIQGVGLLVVLRIYVNSSGTNFLYLIVGWTLRVKFQAWQFLCNCEIADAHARHIIIGHSVRHFKTLSIGNGRCYVGLLHGLIQLLNL